MELGHRRLFEFAVVAVVLAVLGHFLLAALEDTRREVEGAAVQAEIAAMRVDLLDRLSHKEGLGGTLPASNNPVDWIGRAPAGYLGVLEQAPEARGVWYFHRPRQLLVYRYRQGGEACFRLVRQGSHSAVPGALGGIGLARVGEP